MLYRSVYLVEYQTIKCANNFKANYDKILEVLTSIKKREQFLYIIKFKYFNNQIKIS